MREKTGQVKTCGLSKSWLYAIFGGCIPKFLKDFISKPAEAPDIVRRCVALG